MTKERRCVQIHAADQGDGTWQASILYHDATHGTGAGQTFNDALWFARRADPQPIVSKDPKRPA